MKGLIAKKVGMTQVFDESGNLTPVTVIRVEPNTVVATKKKENCGYDAVVLGLDDLKPSKVSKPYAGQFTENVTPKRTLKEFRDFEGEVKVIGYIDGEEIIIDNVEFSKTVNQDIEFVSKINKSPIKENKLARALYNLIIKPIILWLVVSVMMLLCLIVATTFIDRSRIGYLVLMATVVIIHIFFYQIYKFLLKKIIL